jgi:translation initiation factor IF-2
MANQDLVNYIKQTLAAGFSEDQIREAIVKQGWPENEIWAAFEDVKKPSTPKFIVEAQIKKPIPTLTKEKPVEIKPEEKPIKKPIEKPLEAKKIVEMPMEKPAAPKERVAEKELPPSEEKIISSVEKLFGTPAKKISEEKILPEAQPSQTRPLTILEKKSATSKKEEPRRPEKKPAEIKNEIKITNEKKLPLPKIGIVILGIALIVLATYFLIISPEFLIPKSIQINTW